MDEDFDLGGFDEAYDISDFGDDQAFSMDDRAPVTTMFGGGDYVDTGVGDGDSIASILNPALSSANRTNITNVGAGSNLVYDPAFAAALDITKGIDPTLNLGGTGGLTVPSYLRPQIPGEFMTTDLGEADMVRPMFNSQLERILQQTLPEIVKSGPIARLARGIGSVFQEGIDFIKDSTAGIKVPDLKEFTGFVDRFKPQRTVTDTNAMNMPEAAIIREKYDYGDRPLSAVMGQNTFGSMPMNTGIANVSPNISNQANQANMAVTDALQLVPSEFQDTPTDLGSGIRIAPGSGANRFKFTTSTGDNLPGLNPLGDVFDIIDARNLEKEINKLSGEEKEFLAGKRDRIVGTPSRFVTTTPNLSVPGFRSKSMSEKEAEEIKRRLGVL